MTSTTNTESLEEITKQLDALALEHKLDEMKSASSSRKRKKILTSQFHLSEFVGDSLFETFARAVCRVECIPAKELYESWAMALYVHSQFPRATRFADLASGHGLLAWALLVMDHQDQSDRSVVCVDVRMPASADKVAQTMLNEWPHLESKMDFVEGRLEGIVPDSSTVLVGVHCCATLSDKITDLAILGNCPLALVPCCHSRKCLTLEQLTDLRILGDTCTLTDYIDRHRMQRLQESGFHIVETYIPKVYTPKNRLIVAIPGRETKEGGLDEEKSVLLQCRRNPATAPKLSIPVAASEAARSKIRSIAGRSVAVARREIIQHLGLSIFHPPDFVTLQQLQTALPHPKATIATVNDKGPIFFHTIQRHAQTFRVAYPGIPKPQAKEIHRTLEHIIPTTFPGAQIRSIGV